MTWATFKQAVKDQLTVDAQRLSLNNYIEALIKRAVLDLQRYITCLREGHETTYAADDLDTVANASSGTMPDNAEFRSAWYVTTGTNCCRQPLVLYPGGWANRHDLICQHAGVTNCQYYIVINPQATEFIVFPLVESDREVQVTWDGVKLDFDDEDELPVVYDDTVVNAVGLYVKAHLARETRNDATAFVLYMGTERQMPPGTYFYERRELYKTCQDRRSIKECKPTPQSDSTCGSCVCDDETEE